MHNSFVSKVANSATFGEPKKRKKEKKSLT